MQVFIGISVTENADADYTSQRDAALSAIKTYGTDYVLGITVGNEFMLKLVLFVLQIFFGTHELV
jgi:exo-beta-1,3-glucanase (GH17 family)